MSENFYSGRGGKREGAGRKKGVKIGRIKPETVMFARRVTPEEHKKLTAYLKELRNRL